MTLWIIWVLVVSTLFGMAAHIGESALRGIRRQGRWVWVVAILGSALVPAWSFVMPRASATSIEAVGPADTNLDRVVESVWVDIDALVVPGLDQRFDTYLIAFWIAASVLILTGLLVGSWRLRREAATWAPRRIAGHDVLVSEDFGPAVFGVRSPFIVVPRWLLDRCEDTVALVCMHEAQHRAARDTALLTGAAIAAAAMPWNVALWWQVSRLRSAVELDCDERVIAAGAPRTTYASVLLSIGAGTDSYGLVMPRFAQSPTLLERRLTMLITRARKAGRAKTLVSFVAVVGLIVLGCQMPAPADPPAPEPPVASERHPSVFDYPLAAVDPSVVPYRPVVRSPAVDRTVGDVLNRRPEIESIPLSFIDGRRVELAEVRALDPNDIESIKIIKGRAATNLYGPEALNGVITVVMKRN